MMAAARRREFNSASARSRPHCLLREAPKSDRHPQLDPIVGRMHQILLRSQVPLGGLHGGMAQEQLDLLKFGSGCSAEFRA
jgi:hypothetical protein